MTVFDFSEVTALGASLTAAAADLPREVRAVMSKGALNIKTDARDNVSKHPSWKHIAGLVNYDLDDDGLGATIGYEHVGQGKLAGIYEHGSSVRAPHPTLLPAAEREAPRFEKAMLDVAAKVIEGRL